MTERDTRTDLGDSDTDDISDEPTVPLGGWRHVRDDDSHTPKVTDGHSQDTDDSDDVMAEPTDADDTDDTDVRDDLRAELAAVRNSRSYKAAVIIEHAAPLVALATYVSLAVRNWDNPAGPAWLLAGFWCLVVVFYVRHVTGLRDDVREGWDTVLTVMSDKLRWVRTASRAAVGEIQARHELLDARERIAELEDLLAEATGEALQPTSGEVQKLDMSSAEVLTERLGEPNSFFDRLDKHRYDRMLRGESF